jgi:putative hydrolase of the HAD superfamily
VSTIETVIFDLDDTLITYERPAEAVLADAFEAAGVEPFFGVEDYASHFETHLPAESALDLRERCFATLARERDRDPALGRAVAAAYTDERDPHRVSLLDGARAVLDALAGEYPLGVVTNGPRDLQRAKLDATGLADAFDAVVFAGFETAPKPDPEPFECALVELDATAERTVHVGNSLESDVAGANRAGLRSAWVPATRADPDPEPDHALTSLSALLDPPWS